MSHAIEVVELHHHILPVWAKWRREHPDIAPFSLTLDHHADTVAAFHRRRRVKPGGWRNAETVEKDVELLRHDEQFSYAVQSGMVREAVILAHVPSVLAPPEGVRLIVPAFPDENSMLNAPEEFRSLADEVLETDFLSRHLAGLDFTRPYFLDIDCDYILTARALAPADSAFLQKLMQNAELITISKESDYVRLLKLPHEPDLTADLIAEKLAAML